MKTVPRRTEGMPSQDAAAALWSAGDVRTIDEPPPAPGELIEVSEGVLWGRLPLDSRLDHVNVYFLADNDGWVLIDTGSNTPRCQDALQRCMTNKLLGGKDVTQVVVTHFHPDHIGLAGTLSRRGLPVHTSRATWMSAKILRADGELPTAQNGPTEAEIAFAHTAGIQGLELESFKRKPGRRFSSLVAPLPTTYRPLGDGDALQIGDRLAEVLTSDGHAAEQLTLMVDHELAIVGDQILPGIASNLGIPYTEPESEVLTKWIDGCVKLANRTTPSTLVLAGHGLPFYGASTRCLQLLRNMDATIRRLIQRLSRPATAVECLESVYGRTPSPTEKSALIAETVGFLNYLERNAVVTKRTLTSGVYLWSLIHSSKATQHDEVLPIRRIETASQLVSHPTPTPNAN